MLEFIRKCKTFQHAKGFPRQAQNFLSKLPQSTLNAVTLCALGTPGSIICRKYTALLTAGINFKGNPGNFTYYARQFAVINYKPVNDLLDIFPTCLVFVVQHNFNGLVLYWGCLIGAPQLKATLWPLV